MIYTRRHFGKLAMATLPATTAFGKISSKIHGVQIGVATYSYNTLPRPGLFEAIVNSMVDCGIGDCLLLSSSTDRADLVEKARPARGGTGGAALGTVAGRGGSGGLGRAGAAAGSGGRGAGRGPASPEQAAAAEALRQWRLTAPLSYYAAIRKLFADAGLEISGVDTGAAANSSDADLNRSCEITKALGAHYMMCAVPRSVAKRIAPFAEKAGIKVGLQGRPFMKPADPDIMTKPADYEEALGYSKNFGVSLDVGDATWGGWDVVKFIQDTHPRIFALNMKDRTTAGVSMPWGQGDSRTRDILRLVRDRKYPIHCYIDCDYATAEGGTRLADIKRCMEFAKAALA